MKFQYLVLTLFGIASAIPTSGRGPEPPYLEVYKYEQIVPQPTTPQPEVPSSTPSSSPATWTLPTSTFVSSISPPSSSKSITTLTTITTTSTTTSAPSTSEAEIVVKEATSTSTPTSMITESTTSTSSTKPTTTTTQPSVTVTDRSDVSIDNIAEESSASLIYTVQKDSGSPRDPKVHPLFKHHNREHRVEVFNYRCPKQHQIHPCDCLELDKRFENEEQNEEEGSGDGNGISGNATLMIEDMEPHPDHIETVAFCKNIRSVQVLTEAVKGFQGHRLSYFVLDGCKLPPFPNNMFLGIHIVWMEIMNSTMQFHDNFWSANCKSSP